MYDMFENIFRFIVFSPAVEVKEDTVFDDAGKYQYESGYNPYCNGLRCYDRDDYFPVGYSEEELRSIYYDLNQEDGMDLIVESADFDEVDEYYNPGEEEVERSFVLEALVVKKFSSLEKIIRRGMLPSVRKHMKAKDPTIGDPITVLDPIVGKPKKSGGFAYVTAQIPFSDGQVVSIIFHAPEGDGRKIGPSDTVVAFRWLLNKRDITAVVEPENGREATFETVSLRLAQLVGKNAKRFASSQKEVQADKKKLEELKKKKRELEEQVNAWLDKIEGIRLEKEKSDANISRLQAKLARQLAINRELENKLAGLRKAEAEARESLYDRIIKGEFDNLAIDSFIDTVREALEAVDGDGLKEAKNCAKHYMEAHYDSAKKMFVAA